MPQEKEKGFYDYFNENMETLGLPAPRTIFGNVTLAAASIAAMCKYVEKYGTQRTVGEMFNKLKDIPKLATGGVVGVAATGGKVAGTVAELAAAYYVGACIGSLAVATGKSLSGGLSLGDCLATASLYEIAEASLVISLYASNPQLLAGRLAKDKLASATSK